MTCHVLRILTEGAGCKDSDVIWGLLKLSDQAKPSTGQHSTIYALFVSIFYIKKKIHVYKMSISIIWLEFNVCVCTHLYMTFVDFVKNV